MGVLVVAEADAVLLDDAGVPERERVMQLVSGVFMGVAMVVVVDIVVL